MQERIISVEREKSDKQIAKEIISELFPYDATRLQLMRGKWPDEEENLGGFNKSAVMQVILRILGEKGKKAS